MFTGLKKSESKRLAALELLSKCSGSRLKSAVLAFDTGFGSN